MIKKTYIITGFGCAHCAAKTEAHLNKHPNIQMATIDFSSDKLFVVYENEEMSIDELLKVIAEVEDDEVTILSNDVPRPKVKIIDKNVIMLFIRIAITIAIMIIAHTALMDDKYFWYVFGMYLAGMIIISYDIIWRIIKNIRYRQNPIDEYLLIMLASIGAFLIATLQRHSMEFMESTMVALLFQVGAIIKHVATNKSKEAVQGALDLRVNNASLVTEKGIQIVQPKDLKIGDIIVVTAGELIPIDGVVDSGDCLIDTSSLTGEFVPIEGKVGDEVFSGCLIKSGSINVKVTKEYSESTTSKIVNLISEAGAKKSKADEFVTKFARWYTPIVFVVSILTGIIASAVTSDWYTWMILGLKMLLVACPCAIVISAPMAYYCSIGLASKNGIVIKSSNYLDELNKLKKVVTDKTGTLTHGNFQIVEVHTNNCSEEELLHSLFKAEMLSKHPIGKAICSNAEIDCKHVTVENFNEIPGYGVECDSEGKHIIAGNTKFLDKNNVKYELEDVKGTVVHCAVDSEYKGFVILSDQVKEDAAELISDLKSKDIDVVLLTGDKEENAKELCDNLGINKYYSELLPEQKIEYLNKEKGKGYTVAFVGDGMNDAASIKNADVGFAMGGVGSDVAVDSADVVIMTDKPKKIFDTYRIAKIARHTAIFNIVFALVVKFTIELYAIISSLLGHGELLPMWGAVIADTGLTVLLILNSMLILYRKIDKKKK